MVEHIDKQNGGDLTGRLEKWLGRDWVRLLLGWLSKDRPGTAVCHLEHAILSYGQTDSPLYERVVYWPVHKLFDTVKGTLTRAELVAKIRRHRATLRGIIATGRSVAKYGLAQPQRWVNPLFVVWNLTNQCDMNCRYCYQMYTDKVAGDELTLNQKLDLIDQFGRAYVAMVAFSGGEPTLSDDLEICFERCKRYDIHTTLATHGGGLIRERCERYAELGLKYVEVPLDSVEADKHDKIRGVRGAWQRAVDGIKNVVETEGLASGLAMCVTRDNFDQVEKMIELAVDLGVEYFAHSNYVPTGRASEMWQLDITPGQREELMLLLHKWMRGGKLSVLSTAPQFERVCLEHREEGDLIPCSHVGNGFFTRTVELAKYLGGCGAGRLNACVQANGDVTPCVYMPNRTMGNIKDKAFAEVFADNQWWDLLCNRDERDGNCGLCEDRIFCGGCRARSEAYYGRLDQSDPGCVRNEGLWRQLTTLSTKAIVSRVDNLQNVYKHLEQ